MGPGGLPACLLLPAHPVGFIADTHLTFQPMSKMRQGSGGPRGPGCRSLGKKAKGGCACTWLGLALLLHTQPRARVPHSPSLPLILWDTISARLRSVLSHGDLLPSGTRFTYLATPTQKLLVSAKRRVLS